MAFDDKAPKMILANMTTGESHEAQFNPEQFNESIGVNYAKLQVPGLSHSRKHFINTEDVKFDFELWYHAVGGTAADLATILEHRKFLYALTHPWRADGINRGGPPRVLFIWPTFISLTCVITGLTFNYTQFSKAGAPIAWKAKVTLEEIRDTFVSMEDILSLGTQRADIGQITTRYKGEF
jgi:hypothetical protein